MTRPERSQVHGREAESTSLKEEISVFCSERPSPHSLRIVGISGYGGVGKSYLLSGVLRELRESLDECLIIRVDGSEPKLLADFAAIIDHQLAPHPLATLGANPKYEYFALTRKLVRTLNKLREGVDRELDHDKRVDENIKKTAKVIYRLRPLASKIPQAGPYIDFLVKSLEALGVEEHVKPAHVKAALETLDSLKTLKGPRGFLFYRRLKETLRRDPSNAIADAYRRDLHAIISRYHWKDAARLVPGKIKSLNRLVLIVDDFETVGKVLGDFIVESLLRQLENSRFPVLAIFVGRDDIADAHTGFHQHFTRAISKKIRLEPFEPNDAINYLERAGYSVDEARELYRKSGGYPFVLSLFAEHRSNKEQQSALFHKRFFERTTHWMTEPEKDWLLHLCHLDVVNEGTIAAMLPDVSAGAVLEWFTEEASVRDVAAEYFVVQPFIRQMLLEYQKKITSSKKWEALVDRGRRSLEAA